MNVNDLSAGTVRQCTGCGACAAVCPRNAIRLELNEEGFFAPAIRQNCVNCGICRRVCVKFVPADSLSASTLQNGTLFAAASKSKEVLMKSTSGGAAFELARNSLLNQFEVAGVKYDSDHNRAFTALISKPEMLGELQGSKYLQSLTFPSFAMMLSAAKDGSKFAVFGTPCQIFGLDAAAKMQNVRGSFVFAEVFCHGVPSYFLWSNYANWLKRRKKTGGIQSVRFRSKRFGWHFYTMDVSGDKVGYLNLSQNDPFYQIYFDHAALCPACYNCPFRAGASRADVRLGDFWGGEYKSNRDGVSAAVALTDTGRRWLEASDLHLEKKISAEQCLAAQSRREYPLTQARDDTLQMLRDGINIKRVRRNYRRHFSVRHRLKLFVKETTGFLPLALRTRLFAMLTRHIT